MKADRELVTRLLKTARGQIDGILKMVEEDRYCVDISHQLMAAESVLKRANLEVLKAHLKGCVSSATTEAEKEQKMDEMIDTLARILRENA